MPVGQSVITVFADDRDAPHNARVTYELKQDLSEPEHARDVDFFKIREDGGEIMLVEPIPPDVSWCFSSPISDFDSYVFSRGQR